MVTWVNSVPLKIFTEMIYLTCVINNFFQVFYSYETLPFKIHLYLNMMLLQFFSIVAV